MIEKKRPTVSVYIPTYFHEKYIAQAVESVLMQKTTFSVEIIIVDDASQDDTVSIINDYVNKYKNISCYINKKNIGLSKNMLLGKQLCTGKYIIELSGDDYWIDELKLQKQVDFLEKHPEYIAVCTRIEARADDEIYPLRILPKINMCERTFTKKMFLQGNNLPLNGMLMRNVMLDKKLRDLFESMPKISPYIDDLTDNLFILIAGNVFILKDVTVAYRTRVKIKSDKNFNSSNKGLMSYERHIELLNNLDCYLNQSEDLFNRYKLIIFSGFIKAIKIRKLKSFYVTYKTIPSIYRKRGLLVACICMIPQKILNRILLNSFGG